MMLIMEIIGGFIFFGILSFLSLIILPSLFGCFGFILFWVVLLSLIIFFSINIGWFLLFAVIIYAALLMRKYSRYKSLPDYDSYLLNNPNAYHDGKASCNVCGSEHLIHSGLYGNQAKSRYYVCLKCKSWLYKFKVI